MTGEHAKNYHLPLQGYNVDNWITFSESSTWFPC